HPTAHRQRHETCLGGTAYHVENDVPVLMARGDVQEGELIGACGIVRNRGGHGIARVAQVDELHSLHHAPVLHVETGNEADLDHLCALGAELTSRNACTASSRPS